MATKVTISGLRELDRALGQLSKATGKNVLRRALRKGAEPIAQNASALAPDDPATPEKSIKVGVGTQLTPRQRKLHRKMFRNDKASVEMFVGQEGSDPAGVQQEFGNVNHGPQPFMRPAWESGKDALLNRLKNDMAEEIEKAAKRAAAKAARLG